MQQVQEGGWKAEFLRGEELKQWLADGMLHDGDQIFQAHLVATVVETRQISLRGV